MRDATLPTATPRSWWIEFDSQGSPFVWRGDAHTEQGAERRARDDLARDHADFDREGARLVACLER